MLNEGVYFILASEVNRVKIGHSKNVKKRFSNIQSTSPCILHVISVIEGGEDVETALHTLFNYWHITGEWFDYSQCIQTWLMEHADMKHIDQTTAVFLQHMEKLSEQDFEKSISGLSERTGLSKARILEEYESFPQSIHNSVFALSTS